MPHARAFREARASPEAGRGALDSALACPLNGVLRACGTAGKLAAEYLKEKNYPIKWGVCGRNEGKVKEVLTKLGVDCPVEVADLVRESAGMCVCGHV